MLSPGCTLTSTEASKVFQLCNTGIQMTKQELETASKEFWETVEREAAEIEVTVDYYLAEFFCS